MEDARLQVSVRWLKFVPRWLKTHESAQEHCNNMLYVYVMRYTHGNILCLATKVAQRLDNPVLDATAIHGVHVPTRMLGMNLAK